MEKFNALDRGMGIIVLAIAIYHFWESREGRCSFAAAGAPAKSGDKLHLGITDTAKLMVNYFVIAE